ncbi:MAG: chemotaxis-specific protein-glutamate methyltransferase CheB [Desulfuromonas sp.]|nr:chemotaxis-specific protein-glutamate methyltransferase CheB [Desulfuromonas sp.]
MIKALIVEDSPVERELLTYLLNSDPQIEVIGVANNGEEALGLAEHLKPDVITMDIHMPYLNGYETTLRIMQTNPVPIIIVSGSFIANDMDKTFMAVEAGALAIVKKPNGIGHSDHVADANELLRTVKIMSEVKVVKRWPKTQAAAAVSVPVMLPLTRKKTPIRLVAIGASTGGPAVLHEIFAALPKNFAVPIMAVQHMSRGFIDGFVKWLAESTGLPVHVATHGELLMPGHIYFAPDDKHMLAGKDFCIHLSNALPENGLRPAVSALFRSVEESYGMHAAAVLLTGMGKDGADELKKMRQSGALTIVQDRETSVVYGMPGAALVLDAAECILPPLGIAEYLVQLVT